MTPEGSTDLLKQTLGFDTYASLLVRKVPELHSVFVATNQTEYQHHLVTD